MKLRDLKKLLETVTDNDTEIKVENGEIVITEPKPKDITERIKTFDDARTWCCLNNYGYLEREREEVSRFPDMSPDLVAYLKLRIITTALNEGWKPTFAEDEWRYFPWFCIYSKEEWERLSDERKASVVGRAFSYSSAHGGLVYAVANNASSYSYTSHGSRLAFKSEELAEYAGKQFIDIYADFCGSKKGGEK